MVSTWCKFITDTVKLYSVAYLPYLIISFVFCVLRVVVLDASCYLYFNNAVYFSVILRS